MFFSNFECNKPIEDYKYFYASRLLASLYLKFKYDSQ